MRTAQGHWQRIYAERESDQVSWYEPRPETSLRMIEEAAPPRRAAIIDVGGGASRLAAELLGAGFSDVTVADISANAIDRARSALGERGDRVSWVVADVRDHDFGRRFDLWHDRAVFHFMVEPADRQGYLETLRRSLNPGGKLIIATFGPDGPTECSGLPTSRYGAEEIVGVLGPDFELLSSRLHDHRTPTGASQQFLYALLRRRQR